MCRKTLKINCEARMYYDKPIKYSELISADIILFFFSKSETHTTSLVRFLIEIIDHRQIFLCSFFSSRDWSYLCVNVNFFVVILLSFTVKAQIYTSCIWDFQGDLPEIKQFFEGKLHYTFAMITLS